VHTNTLDVKIWHLIMKQSMTLRKSLGDKLLQIWTQSRDYKMSHVNRGRKLIMTATQNTAFFYMLYSIKLLQPLNTQNTLNSAYKGSKE
jgi:hypothetical protein